MVTLAGQAAPDDATTPVRSVGAKVVDGCRVLSSPAIEYVDGAEASLFDIIAVTDDVTSNSDALALQARNWPQQYHLSSARANILRALTLRPEMSVLEVGAGCGALTRYLGENCAHVDALEPVLARARVARARTRDLPGVQVFVGGLSDVPAKPVYDLVVVVGVLEYVGAGSPDHAVYRSFLLDAAARLADGGTLLLAIENALGVKYMAGAPEDHSGRPFDSLEGYPNRTPARTFPRSVLSGWMADAGLCPTFLGAFPDYKLTRVLQADGLFKVSPDLTHRLVRFPSPDWVEHIGRAASEGAMWRTLVDAGLGTETPNSFVVLASRDTASSLWPKGRLAAQYQIDRRAEFASETTVIDSDGQLHFDRRLLGASPGSPDVRSADSPETRVRLSLTHGKSDLVAGQDMMDVLAASTTPDLADWLHRWVALLDHELESCSDVSPLDALPHNVVVAQDGHLVLVDSKWSRAGVQRDQVLARCALVTSLLLTERASFSRWGVSDGEQMALHIGHLLGLPPDGAWLEAAVAAEARFQDEVSIGVGRPLGGELRVQYVSSQLWGMLHASSVDGNSRRDYDLERLSLSLASTQNRLARIEGSLVWQLIRPLLRVRAALRKRRRLN